MGGWRMKPTADSDVAKIDDAPGLSKGQVVQGKVCGDFLEVDMPAVEDPAAPKHLYLPIKLKDTTVSAPTDKTPKSTQQLADWMYEELQKIQKNLESQKKDKTPAWFQHSTAPVAEQPAP